MPKFHISNLFRVLLAGRILWRRPNDEHYSAHQAQPQQKLCADQPMNR